MSTDIVISFDTTGSMSPCIREVRRRVKETVGKLFDNIPELRISIIAHGDYCDGSLCYSNVEFTSDKNKLVSFIEQVPNTNGGDSDECYEFVLHQINNFNWTAENRALILIADALPHKVGYTYGPIYNEYDWVTEAKNLANRRVSVYAVEALGSRNSKAFYEPLSELTNGRKLDLNQFTDAVETIIAISYHSGSKEKLGEYKQELENSFKMNRNLAAVFNALGHTVKIETDKSGLIPVPPYRFQILHVDNVCDIKSFVEKVGIKFRKGRGFYQFTKSETVQ